MVVVLIVMVPLFLVVKENLVKVKGLGPVPFHLLVLVTHWWHCHLRLCNLLNIREIIWWQAILGNI